MATATTKRTKASADCLNGVSPPLESGDHLTRAEFERRYDAMPNLKKAELLEGLVYVPSPVRHPQHGRPQYHLATWLGTYEAATPGVQCGGSTLRLDDENEPQPDGLLLIEPECGGQTLIDEEGYIVGGPELVAEISASSVSRDLKPKLRVYRRHRVQEYVVVRVLDEEVDWFTRRRGQFQRLRPGRDGILRSEAFPGLWLDPAALIRRDLIRVLEVLNQGLASPKHAAFVARLAVAKKRDR